MKFKKSTRFLLSLCLMTLTFLCGGNKAWAADVTYSYIQTGNTSPFKVSGQTGTATLSGVAWTVTSTATTLVTAANTVSKTNQFYFGNSNNKPGTLTFKTSGISGTIKSISIKAKVQNSESKATITMSVNGSSYTSGGATSVKISGTSFNTYTFTGSSSGEIIITAGNFTAGYFGIASITIVYEKATTTPTLKASSTSLSFPQTEANTSSIQTFTLSGKNLTGDATLSLSGTNAKLFNVTPTTVTQTDGAITNETVTVTYTPTEAGTHTATLTISSDGANEQKITLNGTAYQIYNVNWKVNGADYTEGTPTTKVKSGSAVTTLPTAPSDIAGRTFVGWTNAEITTSSVSAPAILFTKAVNAPTVTDNVTYYAVFASASGTGEGSEELTKEEIVKLGTLAYKTGTNYSGAKLNYSIFGYKDGANYPWIQLKNDKGSYIKITAPSNITKMDLKISSASNSSGGIEDISKHTIFSKTDKVGLVTEDCSFTTSSKNIGSILGQEIRNNLVTIETTSESKVVYLKVSTGARIWGITTYFSDLTYSNYATTVPLSFSFSDTENLATSLPTSPLADQTITLNRNLYSGWNTFCVPFALTQEQLEEAYGNGAVAKYLESVTIEGENTTLHFAPEKEGDIEGGIKANKAYLLYLTADVMEPQTFSGVTLEPAGTCTTTVKATNGDDYTFQGILKPTTLETDDTQYFLNSLGTNFVLPSNSTSAMKATRAYITVPTPSGSAQGRQYSFDFNGTTTGIDNVNISGLEDGGAWYTISGIRVNRPAAKGVYIHNGRKVIVK